MINYELGLEKWTELFSRCDCGDPDLQLEQFEEHLSDCLQETTLNSIYKHERH